MRKSKIICIDIETTGLDRDKDEVLQISIVNGKGKVLLNTYVRPEHLTEWPEAERIHKINWGCVWQAGVLGIYRDRINRILRKAGMIVGYNLKAFDLPFLSAKGIDTAVKAKVYDVMLEFAYIYGEKTERGYKWQKLTKCAEYYGYTDYRAHDSLEDVRATLHCFYSIRRDRRGRKLAKKRKKEMLR